MSDRKPMDCGDNSCAFEGRSRGGMRTNGGCCCLKDLDFDKRMRAMGYIRELEAKLAEARVRLVDMYERIIPEEIAKGCALPETRVKELEAALRLGAEAYVAALPDASTDAMTDLAIERNALRQENERLREALGRVLTEAGLQAHKHGCANKIARPAQWDARLPCAGCQAESALQGVKCEVMDLGGHWYTLSLEEEIEANGTYRIAGEHNRLREENAWLRDALRAISMLDHHDHSNPSEAGELARAVLRGGVE